MEQMAVEVRDPTPKEIEAQKKEIISLA